MLGATVTVPNLPTGTDAATTDSGRSRPGRPAPATASVVKLERPDSDGNRRPDGPGI